MTLTLLLLFLSLLFSSASPKFPEPTEFELPTVEEVPTPSGEEIPIHSGEELPIPSGGEEVLVIPSEEQHLSGWTTLDLAQVNSNAQIQGLLVIGVQNATQQAVQDGSLPDGTYSLVKVNSIEQNQGMTNVQDYRFDVDVSNGQGTNETIIFEMTYNSTQGTSEVTSYSVPGQEIQQQHVETETEQPNSIEEETLSGYFQLNLSLASNDPKIQGLLQIGVQNATEQAIQNGSLPQGVYQLAQINSIQENSYTVEIQEYQFDVNISSSQGGPVSDLVFNITYDPSSGSSQVTSYSILNNQNQGQVTPSPPEETYTPLDVSAISTNAQIQGLLAIAMQNVSQQVTQIFELPSSTYQLSQILSAAQGTLNPNDYQFNISITNNQGTTADAFFTLIYNNVSGTTNVSSLSIYNLVNAPVANNTTNNTPNTNQNFNSTVIPQNNNTFNTQNTGTTTTTTSLNGLPAGFTPVDINSSEGQLAYQVGSAGFYTVESSAILNGQLPYSYFTLTSVNGVGEQQQGGYVYYWFDINIANGAGNSARLVYTMSYDTSTGGENVLQYNVYNAV